MLDLLVRGVHGVTLPKGMIDRRRGHRHHSVPLVLVGPGHMYRKASRAEIRAGQAYCIRPESCDPVADGRPACDACARGGDAIVIVE